MGKPEDTEATELTATQQIRIASLNAVLAMGGHWASNPQKACQLAEKLQGWIECGNLPHPYPGEIWD